MWRGKTTEGILDSDETEKMIKNVKKAQAAILKLKWVLGARMYMMNPKIEEFFRKQKERIGDILEKIDTEMGNHPKSGQPWTKKDLKKAWGIYMDEKFDIAKSRVQYTMDTHIKQLEKLYLSRGLPKPPPGTLKHDIMTMTQEISKSWKTEQQKPWTKPWK